MVQQSFARAAMCAAVSMQVERATQREQPAFHLRVLATQSSSTTGCGTAALRITHLSTDRYCTWSWLGSGGSIHGTTIRTHRSRRSSHLLMQHRKPARVVLALPMHCTHSCSACRCYAAGQIKAFRVFVSSERRRAAPAVTKKHALGETGANDTGWKRTV